MSVRDYDVIIAGGGVAGLTLALQLKLRRDRLRILVLEKATFPVPAVTHKIGESLVEVGSHYLADVLGLKEHLQTEHLPKLGLRYFFTSGKNEDIARRMEYGLSDFFSVPTYQIERGTLENELHRRVVEKGVEVIDGTVVRDLAVGQRQHSVTFQTSGGTTEERRCRWLVDAAGRTFLLKRKLGLLKKARHTCGASWCRIGGAIDVAEWSESGKWARRVRAPRRLSTNHLMGEGYWLWLIPLASGGTSIGVVFDNDYHPASGLNSPANLKAWLEKYEPQLARQVGEQILEPMDFKCYKHFSYGTKQMFSSDGWFLTGDSGFFLDPFYSPGIDFVSLANTFISEVITRDHDGEDTTDRISAYNKVLQGLFTTYLPIYQGQYGIMGNPLVQTVKVVWDFAVYWSGIALLFSGNHLTDDKAMERVGPVLQRMFLLHFRMQRYLQEWNEADTQSKRGDDLFFDYLKFEPLARLNRELTQTLDHEQLEQRMKRNLEHLFELAHEIQRHAGALSAVAPMAGLPRAEKVTQHLEPIFEAFNPVGWTQPLAAHA